MFCFGCIFVLIISKLRLSHITSLLCQPRFWKKVILLYYKVLVLCFQTLRVGAIYRFPFWERFLFCPTLHQTCCHEDTSAQETPPHGVIGYEGWDSLISWQLPPNRMLPGGGEKGKGRLRSRQTPSGSSPLAVRSEPQSKQHHLLKEPTR